MVFGWIKSSWSAVKNALRSTRNTLTDKIRTLFGTNVNEALLDELEEILFEADLGVKVIHELMKNVRVFLKKNPQCLVDDLLAYLEECLVAETSHLSPLFALQPSAPTVILIVGANGTGKTTSIAKIAKFYLEQKKTVMLAAADTFRAAAQEQIAAWAERLGIFVIRAKYNADPAAVAFDAVTAARARAVDVLLIDTAGRLENKEHLLRELEKLRRSCQKALPSSPHETLLVLDATIGQNGVEQARAFHKATPLTGLILTKIDGSAKGGVVISIQKQLEVPVKFLGVGETLDALCPYDPKAFVHSMFYEDEKENKEVVL
jgi:fused signal recognition particle receptor